MTVVELESAFPTENHCRTYLATNRWPNGAVCPRCCNPKPKPHSTIAHTWQCYACSSKGYRFSILVGTVFEDTHLPLRTWFRVIHMMLTSKIRVRAVQVHRTIGTASYDTARYLCLRVRTALQDQNFRALIGIATSEGSLVGHAANAAAVTRAQAPQDKCPQSH